MKDELIQLWNEWNKNSLINWDGDPATKLDAFMDFIASKQTRDGFPLRCVHGSDGMCDECRKEEEKPEIIKLTIEEERLLLRMISAEIRHFRKFGDSSERGGQYIYELEQIRRKIAKSEPIDTIEEIDWELDLQNLLVKPQKGEIYITYADAKCLIKRLLK